LKRLIRRKGTQEFLTPAGTWTRDHKLAQLFQTDDSARQARKLYNLKGCERITSLARTPRRWILCWRWIGFERSTAKGTSGIAPLVRVRVAAGYPSPQISLANGKNGVAAAARLQLNPWAMNSAELSPGKPGTRSRAWTKKEQQKLFKDYFDRMPGTCPICGRMVSMMLDHRDEVTIVRMLCRGCHNWAVVSGKPNG
jgi:hypothetical protein